MLRKKSLKGIMLNHSKKIVLLLSLMVFLCMNYAPSVHASEGQIVARKILALHNVKSYEGVRYSRAHLFAEMPLNYLGYDVNYQSIYDPLPSLGKEYRAVLFWLSNENHKRDMDELLDWLIAMSESGKKIIIIGSMGVSDEYKKRVEGRAKLNKLYALMGMRDTDSYESVTYKAEILYRDKEMTGFERDFKDSLPAYGGKTAIDGKAKTYLRVRSSPDSSQASDLIIAGQHGGYISANYALFKGLAHTTPDNPEDKKRKAALKQATAEQRGAHIEGGYAKKIMQDKAMRPEIDAKKILRNKLIRLKEKQKLEQMKSDEDETYIYQWYVNPFLFFSKVLDEEVDPKVDITTINGRRIFYSHIDGDGWNNVSEIRKYRKKQVIAADVVRLELLEPYPDLPVTVSVVTSDIDESCYGLPVSRKAAIEVFKLPHIQAGSHTHSHPLEWSMMDDPAYNAKEVTFLNAYPKKPSNTGLYTEVFGDDMVTPWEAYFNKHPEHEAKLNTRAKNQRTNEIYSTPRSYACEPFSMEREIEGSIAIIKELVPEGKEVDLIQWSGDTSPTEKTLKRVREAGFQNINGGDSRYDNEYPSYTAVAPYGLRVGKEVQVYSSNSNENTYTDLWTGRFYGFKYLQNTVMNTGQPKRVAPFNIYYHMYSGQKNASVNAVKENLNFARKSAIIPLTTSQYVKTAQGFYSTTLHKVGEKSWRITNRKNLQTIRFDRAFQLMVDFDKSSGVLGYNYHQGSLYVSLDPVNEAPIVSLKRLRSLGSYASESSPYLIESNWIIKDLQFVNSLLTFKASGFGQSLIRLRMPSIKENNMAFEVEVAKDGEIVYSAQVENQSDGILEINIPPQAGHAVHVVIKGM